MNKPGYVEIPLVGEVGDRMPALGKSLHDWQLHEEGREDYPHVTVRYGILTDDAELVRECLAEQKSFKIKLTKLSIFEGSQDRPFDVLKVNVTGPRLHWAHDRLGKAPHRDSFPDYKPHATIAYVKKGLGKNAVSKLEWEPVEYEVTEMVFHDSERRKHVIPLGN